MKRSNRVLALCGALLLVVGCTATVPQTEESQPVSSAASVPSLSDASDSATTPQSADPAAVTTTATAAALPLNPTIIILDASGSMKADDAPGPRIDAAKSAVLTLVDGLPDGAPLGLIVYGTGTDSSDAAETAGCQDIKILVPLAAVDKATFAAAVNGVAASGYLLGRHCAPQWRNSRRAAPGIS
jgi:von Willebrand factor type A domain